VSDVDTSCPFCRNLAGLPAPKSGPCAPVILDDLTLTFVNPVALGGHAGHLLVIPRRHAATLLDLTDDESSAVMKAARRAVHAIETVLHPDGILLLQRNGAAAGQEVFHFHLHIIPRAHGTPFPPDSWIPLTPNNERVALAQRLRTAMS
jgi:histidine triad (HIT) family protein